MKRILFIDDHAVVRSSFTKVLSEPFKPVEVDEAGNGEEAVVKINNGFFDLIIMDVQMPDTDTLKLVEFICSNSPATKILMLSMASEIVYAKRYLKAGANGYVSKQASLNEVYKAMDTVMQGKIYISDIVAESIVRESGEKNPTENPFEKLSKKEYEIVTMLLQGKSVSEISKLLNAANSTIGTHKARLFKKLNVANLIELKDLSLEYKL